MHSYASFSSFVDLEDRLLTTKVCDYEESLIHDECASIAWNALCM